jgi:pimeloyl-ACP methyl ester carboxylesterase
MKQWHWLLSTIIMFVMLTISNASCAALFAGERIETDAGFPTLTKFIPGDPNRPLVVFIPGAVHNARISYGGHPGGRDDDFLAYWLVREGYNFLGVSYPLTTKNPVIKEAYPNFDARDWGTQAAAAARRAIDEHHLTNKVIVIGWSMGGRIAEPIAEAAEKQGLNLEFFLSFSGTPGITGLVDMNANYPMTTDGYMDRSDAYPMFMKQIALENSMNAHTIIDTRSYLDDYVGYMPGNIGGYGLHYRDGKFVRDNWADEEEFRVHAYDKLPYIAALMANEPLDARHALTDRANWGFVMTNKIQAAIEANKVDLNALPRARWLALVDLVRGAPQRLSVEMNGDHFFFLGAAGARETARAIYTLEDRVAGFKSQLQDLVGGSVGR